MTLWISLSVALALPTPHLWWRWRKRENLNQENAHGRWKPPTLCELLKTVLKLFSNHTGILKKRRKKLKDWCQRQRSRQSSTLKKFSMKLRFIYILGDSIDTVVATQIKSDCANIGRYKNTPQAALQGLSSVAERPYERLCQAEHFFAKCLRQCRGNRVFKAKWFFQRSSGIENNQPMITFARWLAVGFLEGLEYNTILDVVRDLKKGQNLKYCFPKKFRTFAVSEETCRRCT